MILTLKNRELIHFGFLRRGFVEKEWIQVSIHDSFLLFTIHKGKKNRDTRFSRFKIYLSTRQEIYRVGRPIVRKVL